MEHLHRAWEVCVFVSEVHVFPFILIAPTFPLQSILIQSAHENACTWCLCTALQHEIRNTCTLPGGLRFSARNVAGEVKERTLVEGMQSLWQRKRKRKRKRHPRFGCRFDQRKTKNLKLFMRRRRKFQPQNRFQSAFLRFFAAITVPHFMLTTNHQCHHVHQRFSVFPNCAAGENFYEVLRKERNDA